MKTTRGYVGHSMNVTNDGVFWYAYMDGVHVGTFRSLASLLTYVEATHPQVI